VTLRLSQSRARRSLSRPVRNALSHWSAREASIITLESDTGARGRGEVAPLPGFSPDHLADCERALNELDLTDIPDRLAPGAALISELSRASSRLSSTLPAARAGLEAALLELWARAAGQPAWALLPGAASAPTPRRVASLLMSEPEDLCEDALAARARGVSAFKIKVGQAGLLERELAALARLRAELGARVELRLDANRAWSAAEARSKLSRFAEYAPEFVEEPCAFSELAELTPSPVSLALDESLAELSVERTTPAVLTRLGVRAMILKPTLLGGLSVCCAWAELAREIGAPVILSHAFEGPLGLAASAALALSIGCESAAHGLDLQGARLEHLQLPFFATSEIRAWSAPGFGDLELDA
jgi:o-succinylbenzoate synthase